MWERYKTWKGQVDFEALLKASTFLGISWTSGGRDYADMKENEHGANYSNLMRFRESLPHHRRHRRGSRGVQGQRRHQRHRRGQSANDEEIRPLPGPLAPRHRAFRDRLHHHGHCHGASTFDDALATALLDKYPVDSLSWTHGHSVRVARVQREYS